MEFDISGAVQNALGENLVTMLVSLVLLPLAYRLVGISKNERREREQQSIRLIMDLQRGLGELAAAAPSDEERNRYGAMREQVLDELRDRTSTFFENKKFRVAERYILLPKPKGFFGVIWSVLAVLYAALFVMVVVALIAAAIQGELQPEDGANAAHVAGYYTAFVIFFAIAAAPLFLLRWFAFISARVGRAAAA